MAQHYYVERIRYRSLAEMIFSTPIEASNAGSRSVSIGGSAEGTTIVTGESNVVQYGKYNVSVARAEALHIGETHAH